MKKIALFTAATLVSLNLDFVSLQAQKDDPLHKLDQKIQKAFKLVDQAHAQSANDEIGTFVRLWYFIVNGWPSHDAFLEDNPSGDGLENGLLGLVNDINGGISRLVSVSAGIDSCSEIPTTGDLRFSTRDGSDYVVTYAPGAATSPYDSQIYDKMVTVDKDSVRLLEIEFDCDREAGITRLNTPEADFNNQRRELEIFFDTEDVADSKVDFYMNFPAKEATMAMSFKTYANDKWSYWLVRGAQDDDQAGYHTLRIGTYGDSATKKASAYIRYATEASYAALDASTNGVEDYDWSSSNVNDCADPSNCRLHVCVDGDSATLGSMCAELNANTAGIFDASNVPRSLISSATPQARLTQEYVLDASLFKTDKWDPSN